MANATFCPNCHEILPYDADYDPDYHHICPEENKTIDIEEELNKVINLAVMCDVLIRRRATPERLWRAHLEFSQSRTALLARISRVSPEDEDKRTD